MFFQNQNFFIKKEENKKKVYSPLKVTSIQWVEYSEICVRRPQKKSFLGPLQGLLMDNKTLRNSKELWATLRNF